MTDGTTSLQLMSEASRMLVEASTIQQAKELKDLALTVADWARRKGMGEEAIQYAKSYAVRAERKMGEMLAATERATGTRTLGGGDGAGGNMVSPPASVPTLAELGVTKRESSDAQFLATLPDEQFEEIAVGKRTVSDVRKESKHPHVSQNSGNNEWYTPTEFTEAARSVMGSIDLDPASSESANASVKATRFYTAEDDGLTKEWDGAVWMNPPYSTGLVDRFTEKLCAEYVDGSVEQACVLVNNATETKWFQELLEVAASVCFLRGRIKFVDQSGSAIGTGLQGQAILYFGHRQDEFNATFSEFGQVFVHA